jgi:S1-C subfamily serine protease
MNNRILKVLALLAGFSLVLFVGAIVGGGIVYGLTQMGDVLPAVNAQEADPGYGIVIASVESDGPAAEAGVVRGDILLEMDGEALEHSGDLASYLNELEPGDEVELKVLHGDDLRTLTATLGERDGRAYLGLVPCGGLSKKVEVNAQVSAPGATIVEVMPDSPAEKAGLQKGDVIVAVDGKKLDDENNLADLIAKYKPGDTVTLEIERPDDKEPFEVTVELGEHPDKEGAAYLGVRYSAFPQSKDLQVLPFGKFDELPFAFPEGVEQGAIVQRVYEDSPASAAGLKEGDVITAIDGKPVESPQTLTEAIAERKPGDKITLTVYQRDSEEGREVQVTLAEHPDDEGKAYMGVLIGGFFGIERGSEGGELPFDLDELQKRFKFQWPPYDYRQEPGQLGDSI